MNHSTNDEMGANIHRDTAGSSTTAFLGDMEQVYQVVACMPRYTRYLAIYGCTPVFARIHTAATLPTACSQRAAFAFLRRLAVRINLTRHLLACLQVEISLRALAHETATLFVDAEAQRLDLHHAHEQCKQVKRLCLQQATFCFALTPHACPLSLSLSVYATSYPQETEGSIDISSLYVVLIHICRVCVCARAPACVHECRAATSAPAASGTRENRASRPNPGPRRFRTGPSFFLPRTSSPPPRSLVCAFILPSYALPSLMRFGMIWRVQLLRTEGASLRDRNQALEQLKDASTIPKVALPCCMSLPFRLPPSTSAPHPSSPST